MRKLLEKVIYFAMTLVFFIVLWNIVGELWEMFVSINYKTNLMAIIFVVPVMAAVSLILSGLTLKFIRDS